METNIRVTGRDATKMLWKIIAALNVAAIIVFMFFPYGVFRFQQWEIPAYYEMSGFNPARFDFMFTLPDVIVWTKDVIFMGQNDIEAYATIIVPFIFYMLIAVFMAVNVFKLILIKEYYGHRTKSVITVSAIAVAVLIVGIYINVILINRTDAITYRIEFLPALFIVIALSIVYLFLVAPRMKRYETEAMEKAERAHLQQQGIYWTCGFCGTLNERKNMFCVKCGYENTDK